MARRTEREGAERRCSNESLCRMPKAGCAGTTFRLIAMCVTAADQMVARRMATCSLTSAKKAGTRQLFPSISRAAANVGRRA